MNEIEDFFRESVLHDCKIENIDVDYFKGTVLFRFQSADGKEKRCLIKNLISFSIEKVESWGCGNYVVSSDAHLCNGKIYIEIQLNSGDICKAVCAK